MSSSFFNFPRREQAAPVPYLPFYSISFVTLQTMNSLKFISTLLLVLYARSILADISPETSVVYDVNDAPLLKKVLKMLDGILYIDATRWAVNLTTEELNTKTSLLHRDVNNLGQLLNLSTTTDWMEWDQKYTTAIHFDNQVTNQVSNADHVDNIVNVVDDLNDVIEVGPGIYVNTNRSELCTKLNMIVLVAKNISEVTGGAIQENWFNFTAPLINEINNNLPDPSYSKESYDLIKSTLDDLTDLMDFGIPDWSDVPSSNELSEKLHCFASAMNTFSNLTQVYMLDTWEPAVNHFNELSEKLTSTLSTELVNQLEQAVGAFSGMMNVDVNDWAVKTRGSLDKDLVDLERAVKQLDQALHRKMNSDWEEDVTALHHELAVASTNTSMTHEMKKFKKTASHYRNPKASAPLHEEYKKIHIYIHVTHPHD